MKKFLIALCITFHITTLANAQNFTLTPNKSLKKPSLGLNLPLTDNDNKARQWNANADIIDKQFFADVSTLAEHTDFPTAVSTLCPTGDTSPVKTLIIPTVTASITSNVTVCKPLTLEFTGTGQLNVGSVTLATLTSTEYGTLAFTTTTIDRTTGSWITDGYNVADATITITGSTSNNVTCGVASATALVLTVDAGCTLVTEAASTAETVNGQDPWTVTINGPFECGLRQCIGGAGEVAFGLGNVAILHPQWWGAKGDGVNDDTAAIKSSADSLPDGSVLDFPTGTYLISHTNAGNLNHHGKKVMFFSGRKDIAIRGNGSTIKIVNHDIATNGGLMFMWTTESQGVTVEGLEFDMTFTGTKDSASFYPYVGGLIFTDTATGTHTQADLNADIVVRNLTFKLFHSFGQFVQTTNPYQGDNNNGYKMFSVFAFGDRLGTTYATQNRNFTAKDILFKDGHNGYGVWAWAYNDISLSGIDAEAWIQKFSNVAGAVLGDGVPMIRYHQWETSGINITKSDFRSRPSSTRTTSGFEGGSTFAALTTNSTGNLLNGKSIATDNIINLGNGDAVNSIIDYGFFISLYGDIAITGNTFNGESSATNAFSSAGINYTSESGGGNGDGSLLIDSNIFGGQSSYMNNIVVANGSSVSAAERRLKQLIVTNNISKSQNQYFLDMTGNSGLTHLGVPFTIVKNNIIVGTNNTVWNSASTNSRAIRLAGTDASDTLIVSNNQVTDKNRFILASDVNASATTLIANNPLAGVTTEFVGGSLFHYKTIGGDIISKRIQSTGGAALVAGDFALSAGWGTTASVGTISGNDMRGKFTVTSAGTGQAANPTITLTFTDGTFTTTPFINVVRNGGSQPAVDFDWNETATTLVITWRGTPVAAETFTFSFITLG